MTADRPAAGKKEDMQSRLLPKNYRQIGEPGTKKIYIEDYVYTYLNKMAQPGNLYSRGAILFGKMYQTASGPCLFISGAASCQSIEFDLEETVFSEEVWDEIYQVRDTFFPELTVCGWFLSRMGFSVELNDKIIRMHMDNFSGDHKVLFMMDSLEDEDAFYQFENYSLKKQKGYYIYYESNHEMADYMLSEGEEEDPREAGRTASEILRDSSVVKNYKRTLQQKKAGKQKKKYKWSPSAAAGAVVMAMALIYGAYSVYQFRQGEEMRTVFGQEESVLDINTQAKDDGISEEDTLSENDSPAEDRDESAGDENNAVEDESAGDENNAVNDKTTGRKEASADTAGMEEEALDDTEVFTQEDPDDVVESWSYIGGEYTVKRGDTLASISKSIYESYDYIEKIAEENHIENVDQIYPGQVLKIPRIED